MSRDFLRNLPETNIGGRLQTRYIFHIDPFLLLVLLVIIGYGLVVLYSAVGQQWPPMIAQCTKIGLAFAVMIIVAQIPPMFYMRIAPRLYPLGLVLLVVVLFYGQTINGSQRWIKIPHLLTFQPAELMKLFVPMILAWYLHDRHLPPSIKHLLWAAIIIIVPVLLIGRQPDLGTAVIIGVSGVLTLFFAGMRWRHIFTVAGFAIASTWGLWFALQDYQRQRLYTLFNPEKDPLGAGWQIMQSKIAIGSGGLTGKGLFQGTQFRLGFLPESKTDFIIAVMAEELGFVGIMVLLALYILLLGRGVFIAVQAQDTFSRLLAGAITLTFSIYVLINIGMVIGLLPVVGIPLPLISYGGTSILTLLAGFGIIMSIHTHRRIML